MSAPRVSVVLPTYNAAEHIREAIESLRRQTLDSFEVIVVDDGSTDGTCEVVDGIDDDRFRLISRQEATGGLPGALNRGIEEARANYVARQDADDRSHPNRLAEQVNFLDQSPEVALLGTSARLVRPDGSKKDVRRVMSSPTFTDLLKKNRFVHGAVMFRRDVVEGLGGYEEAFEFSEDYDLWLRIARDYPVRNIQSVLYDLRLHGDSIYASELKAVKLYAALARKRALGRSHPTVEDGHRNVQRIYESLDAVERARFHREMAQALLRYEDRPAAREHAKDGLRGYPADVGLWSFLALSYIPQWAVNTVVWSARRISNARF